MTTNSTSTGTNSTSFAPSNQLRVGPISNRTSARQISTPSNQITSSKKIVHPGKSSATSQRSHKSTKKKASKEMMSIQSIGVTPYYPQPRKEKRAAATAGTNARPSYMKT